MDPAQRALLDLIREHGGINVRHQNHLVYRFPDGKTFTMAKTPSDHRAWLNCLSDLRRTLEIERTFRPNWGIRREKDNQKPQEQKESTSELPAAGIRTTPIQEKLGVALGIRMSHDALMAKLNKATEKYEPPRIHRTHRPRHGEVKTIPPEVLNESRHLSKVWGPEVGEKYVQDYIDEHWDSQKKKETATKEESSFMGNPADILGQMVNNARNNLQNLQESIARHERALEQERAQIKDVQNFLSAMEISAEAAKAAAPALRGIMPDVKVFSRLKSAHGGKRIFSHPRGTLSKEAVKFLHFIKNEYRLEPFEVAKLWRKVEQHPEITISRTTAYGVLAQAAIDKPTKAAILEKMHAGTYRFKPGMELPALESAEAGSPIEATA